MVEGYILGNHQDAQKLTSAMQNSLANFFKEHMVHEVLPDNGKVNEVMHDKYDIDSCAES
jgi:hypothetical protein